MLEGVIVSIFEGVIISCGKTFFQKLSLILKGHKIKKELKKKMKSLILDSQGNAEYFNALDSFLTQENFAYTIIEFCFEPGVAVFKSLSSYITYLTQKFLNANKKYLVYKGSIYHALYSLSKIVFDTINDYSKDETARVVFLQLGELFHEKFEELEKHQNRTNELIERHISLLEGNNAIIDFNNQDIIKVYKSSLSSYYIYNNKYIPRNIYTKNDTPLSSIDCLLKHKHIILLGDPGCGKTYESLNVLKELCTNETFKEYIPIYMKLMEYGIVYDSIFDYMKKQLMPFWGSLSDDQLIAALSSEKFVLILDGVDEILNLDFRIKFFADINQLLSITKAHFYITSRINPYHGNINNIVEYRIKDLTSDQISKELRDKGIYVSISRQFYDLFSNPLFLQIGIKVLGNCGRSKIYNKSQLFNLYIEEVCYNRDRNKQLPQNISKNYYNVLMSIGALAYETFEKASLSFDEFDAFFGSHNKDYSVQNICDFFRIDVFDIGDSIVFSHKHFKEFFAAYYLVKKYSVNENKELYSSLINNEIWQEVIIFASGLINSLEEQNMLLDMILEINLKTYIKAVKHKNDLSPLYETISHDEYSKKYLETLYSSYILIVTTYFDKIKNQFEPYASKDHTLLIGKKICLIGCISQDRKHLHYWFDWKAETEPNVQINAEEDMPTLYKEMEKRAILERRNIITHGVNLDLSDLMGDSARQIAINMVYDDLKKIIENFRLFESNYIYYEKLIEQIKKIKDLKGKSLEEIYDWSKSQIEQAYKNFDASLGGVLVGIEYNGVNVVNVNNIVSHLIKQGETHDTLALPQPDLPYKNGWIWEVYSAQRVKERLKAFFFWRQKSYHQMVEINFPKMRDYFSLSKDSPYKYIIHVKFKEGTDAFSDPGITYYRIAVGKNDSIEPDIMTDEPFPEYHDDNLFKLIMESYNSFGKEGKNITISSAGFNMTLRSHRHSGNMPLTETIYDDFKESFKELFEQD